MPDRTMSRGDTLVFDVQVMQAPPGAAPGSPLVPVDISTWSEFWFTAKNSVADPDLAAVAQLTMTGGGIVIADAPSGKIEITMPPSATKFFADMPTMIVYDVQGRDSRSRIFTLETGTLTVSPDVTRAI